jgi:hypothetical protein
LRSPLVALCVLLTATGCRASARAEANLNTGKSKDLIDEPITPVQEGDEEEPREPDPSAQQALLGARHDLRLISSATAPTCTCLAVAVGAPNHRWFAWIGEPARIDPERQLVIGFNSEGVSCAGAPADSLGASYWGYRREGDDVIVFVESAKFGRPITSGAIIPKPSGSGQVLVRPASKQVPYGRPLDATQKDCKPG